MISDKKTIFAGLAVAGGLIAIIATVSYFGSRGNEDSTYFYYSLTCPHCKVVEEYMAANGTEVKIQIVKKEISESPENAQEFLRRAGNCGIKSEEAGVPMLWKDGKCTVGDQPIINYFKEIDANK